ncbi:hypothetical protein FRC03_002969 [Tulasnella sp. 419]|nr:hypothetical protein FRC03_002969 [Tulasnella sp. 419]
MKLNPIAHSLIFPITTRIHQHPLPSLSTFAPSLFHAAGNHANFLMKRQLDDAVSVAPVGGKTLTCQQIFGPAYHRPQSYDKHSSWPSPTQPHPISEMSRPRLV